MSNHTPEPWNGKRIGIAVHYFESINAEIALTGKSDEAMANASRIVACVNACRGLSTDELEQHGLVSAVGTELMELEKQRDELLSLVEEFATEMQECYDWPDTSSSQEKLARIAEKARNYTGKDKGGAS